MIESSIRNNQAVGVTGALITDGYYFVQALEGERNVVWETFRKIETDKRHSRLKLIEWISGVERQFAGSWMGGAERNNLPEAVFAPYLQANRFDPANMMAAQVLGLLIDLKDNGLGRTLAA